LRIPTSPTRFQLTANLVRQRFDRNAYVCGSPTAEPLAPSLLVQPASPRHNGRGARNAIRREPSPISAALLCPDLRPGAWWIQHPERGKKPASPETFRAPGARAARGQRPRKPLRNRNEQLPLPRQAPRPARRRVAFHAGGDRGKDRHGRAARKRGAPPTSTGASRVAYAQIDVSGLDLATYRAWLRALPGSLLALRMGLAKWARGSEARGTEVRGTPLSF
jgi:hypothetical protein